MRGADRGGRWQPSSCRRLRLFSGDSAVRRAEIGLDLAGAGAVSGPAVSGGEGGHPGDPETGVQFIMRQASCLGGGSTEMARNIISERILGMPREYAADRDIPFSQVRQGGS
jgi:hypothetical protein